MKTKKKAMLGTVISGTMREEDLIPAFCEELRYYGVRSGRLSEIERESAKPGYYESETADYDLEDLFSMLNDLAPEYSYFGSHPGDGSDYGWWLYDDIQNDFDGIVVGDLGEIPHGYKGAILLINDHGNMTLYAKSARKITEIWSVV